MIPVMSEVTKLKTLIQKIEATSAIDDGTWLDHLNASQAFVTCLGAGPWKIARRTLIQKEAVESLGGLDLSQVITPYRFPLEWQNEKLDAMIDYLKRYLVTMSWFAKFLSGMNEPTKMLYEITKTKGRAKVLDLFVRDYLKLPSFPIDRHVERVLKENGFPVNEKHMIGLCEEAGLNVSHVARAFVAGSGKFTGNGKI
jgi:hypothetical protein